MYENVAARVPEAIVEDIDYVAKEENTDKSKVIREELLNLPKYLSLILWQGLLKERFKAKRRKPRIYCIGEFN